MRIRTVLIGIGLAGNLLLALSLFFLFNYRDTTQKSFANESLVSTYEAAWFQTLETSIDAISAWLPITDPQIIPSAAPAASSRNSGWLGPYCK